MVSSMMEFKSFYNIQMLIYIGNEMIINSIARDAKSFCPKSAGNQKQYLTYTYYTINNTRFFILST